MTKLKGIIIPSEWDAQGNVVAAAIATDQEEEYRIADNMAMQEIKAFLLQEVEVSGVLSITDNGKKVIKIRKIKIFDMTA